MKKISNKGFHNPIDLKFYFDEKFEIEQNPFDILIHIFTTIK